MQTYDPNRPNQIELNIATNIKDASPANHDTIKIKHVMQGIFDVIGICSTFIAFALVETLVVSG